MKIIELRSENVKKVRAVQIRPDGAVVTIKGNNGAGKTSVLDSIAYALGGQHLQPPMVIREGESRAKVSLDLGELTVERRWTKSGSTLTVKSRDGALFPSPQKMLDGLVGKLSFDPLSFLRLEPKAQAEALRKLVGLDFTDLDRMRAQTFEKRTAVNRDAEAVRIEISANPIPEGTPTEAVDVSALLDQQAQLQRVAAANEEVRREARAACDRTVDRRMAVARAIQRVEEIEAALEKAKLERDACSVALVGAAEEESRCREAVAKIVEPDLAGVRAKIANAAATNAAVERRAIREKRGARLAALLGQAEQLTAELATVDREKAEALAGAKFPVPGLAFGDDGITLRGIPLVQASAAEQLRVSLAMGLALNPKLKVILIRDGSLLDEKSLAVVGEMAEAAGAQVWLERVGKGGEVGVVIEDGHVAGDEPEAPTEEARA